MKKLYTIKGIKNVRTSTPPTDLPKTIYEVVTYTNPADHLTELLSKTKGYAYAYHDKDTNEDGTPKEPHYHLLIVLTCNMTITALAKKLEHLPCNSIINLVHDKAEAYHYLIHANAPEKYQYPPTARTSSDEHFFDKTKKVTTDNNDDKPTTDDLINDLIEGKPLREMAKKYGRDYIKNRRAYEDFAKDVIREEMHEERRASLEAEVEAEYKDIRRLAYESAKQDAYGDGYILALRELAKPEYLAEPTGALGAFMEENGIDLSKLEKLATLIERQHILTKHVPKLNAYGRPIISRS